jgi:NAD(P)-dependent dehydrogenase (short-subunit alcohol dehydrogenase family)
MRTRPADKRVVVVTGGGGGIGAAIAIELARRGDPVVTVDPLVSVDGTETRASSTETTAGRIVAAGGSAESSNASVTDRDALGVLFAELVSTHGRLDAVVNVAGITRPTGFASGDEPDWDAVLAVHLDGYRNLVEAALPHLAAADTGAILGVTSGSGWRPADAGAYSAAKRAVASLTWELGRVAPPGVSVAAISPIALTRMVTTALARAGGSASATAGASSKTGGLSLGSLPTPEELAPLAAHLVGPAATLRGQILFAGGSEVATVEPPRLLEVVRTAEVASLDTVLDGFADTLVAAEAAQATTGGANPRFTGLFGATTSSTGEPGGGGRSALIVTDRLGLAGALVPHLEMAGFTTRVLDADEIEPGFAGAGAALAHAASALGGLDAVVRATAVPHVWGEDWQAVLASHGGLAHALVADAAWNRAAADHATAERPMRVVHLVDAPTAGGRSRAQANAQQARISRKATADRVAAFAVAVEDPAEIEVAASLAAHLAATADVTLSGAELAVGSGWLGLRSHPRPGASLVYGGPELPPWFDAVLRELA